jgi:hypothetical protein
MDVTMDVTFSASEMTTFAETHMKTCALSICLSALLINGSCARVPESSLVLTSTSIKPQLASNFRWIKGAFPDSIRLRKTGERSDEQHRAVGEFCEEFLNETWQNVGIDFGWAGVQVDEAGIQYYLFEAVAVYDAPIVVFVYQPKDDKVACAYVISHGYLPWEK